VLEWDVGDTIDSFWNWTLEDQVDEYFVNINLVFGFLQSRFSRLSARDDHGWLMEVKFVGSFSEFIEIVKQ
jgi:hypothetical protein